MPMKKISTKCAEIFHAGNGCFAMLALVAVFLSGCATTAPNAEQAANKLDLILIDVDGELDKGQRERALALLNQAAQEHPASMLPWMKIANIWFEDGNYPSSILAANEVLQRDPENQDAKSLVVVAGLRVAAGAVAGLRPNGAVGMSARVEAESLTNSLRGALGEKNLVSGAKAEMKQPRYAPRARVRPTLLEKPKSPVPEIRVQPAVDMADPFRALK